MRSALFAVFSSILAAPVLAQVALPVEFGEVDCWTPMKSWLANPAEGPLLKAEEGVAQFAVSEPRRGMKWQVNVKPFHTLDRGYFLIRYRAENLAAGAGYFIWVFDGESAGRVLVPRSAIRDDGRWHVLAVDVWAAGVVGAVRGFATEVQAAHKVPASVSLDYIRYANDVPPGAHRYAKEAPPTMKWQEDFKSPNDWQKQPGWLGNHDPKATLRGDEGAVVVTVPTAGKGLKCSRRYKTPVDLERARYAVIRYRAERVAPGGDYFVWIGSETGGTPQKSAHLLRLSEVEDDGRWHVHIARLTERFKVAEMAIQVQAEGANARAWFDYVKFSTRRPLIPFRESVPYTEGFRDLRLKAGSFLPIDLSAVANANVRPRMRNMALSGWFEGARVTVDGVPFALLTGGRNVVATPEGKIEPMSVPVGKRAREAYLLVASLLPPEDYSGLSKGKPFLRFDNPERFVVRVRYRDGIEDLHFPVHVRAGRYEMVRGIGVYCLPELRPVPVRELALECRMLSGCMMLAGLTLNTGEAVTPRPHVSLLPPPVPEQPIPQQKPKIQLRGVTFTVETSALRASFDLSRGVGLTSLDNKCLAAGVRRRTRLASASFFELGDGKTRLASDQLKVSGLRQVGHAVVMDIDARPRVPIAGTLRIAAKGPGELVMTLDVRNVSDQAIKAVVNFPAFSRVVLGDVENTWYLYARQGGIVNNLPTVQRRPYSGRYPLQVMGLFNPRLGGGMCLLVRDLGNIYKYYVTDKNDEGVDWRIEYFPREYQPGERIEVAETVLRCHSGDWRAQLAAYKEWTRSWYKPLVPRKDWFRDVYNYRQHLVRGGLFDFEKKRYRMMEVVEADRRFFGRIDYLHIFDFGQSDKYGRVGDYSHYGEIAGREALAAAIAEVKAAGVPVGLYIEGYLCDERSLWGRDHVAEGHIIRKDGKPLLWSGTSTEHMMCPVSKVWQDHLARVYKRVAGELAPSGMYIDQLGFGNEWKICWSRQHGHPVPWPPIRGERELGARIRAAVPPEIATFTEEVPTDVSSQVQDGALGYSICFNDPRLAPHRVDLFRFVFPDFKVIQLVAYNNFVEGGWAKLKFVFFNAEGWWLGNGIPGGFEPAAQTFLRKAFSICHAHRGAFRSPSPKPLVPTQSPLICANEFPAKNETVWTLFNADYRTHRGPVLAVKHVRGATYRDLWNEADIKPTFRDGRAILHLELGPREIGCIRQKRP